MSERLPHVREPSSGEPDVCVHCREEWVDLLTLYETDECSVRLRAEVERMRAEAAKERAAERAAVVAWLRERHAATQEWDGRVNAVSPTYNHAANEIERGEHRRQENE